MILSRCPYQQPGLRPNLYTRQEVSKKQYEAYLEGVETGTRMAKENAEADRRWAKYG